MTTPDMSDEDELFSVWWFDPDGYSTRERDGLGAKEAVELAKEISERPAVPGFPWIVRIIITDWGDRTVFEWRDGEVTFPK